MAPTAEDITRKVKEIIIEQLGVADDEVTPEADLRESLGCDSLDTIELVMAVEAEFGIVIDDEDTEKIKTVRDIHEYLAVHAK